MKKHYTLFLLLSVFINLSVFAEDGSRLWLRLPNAAKAKVTVSHNSPTTAIAKGELQKHWEGTEAELMIDNAISQKDGYTIQINNGKARLCGNSDLGLLYASYELLRMQQMGTQHNVSTSPAYGLRILNHWDNLDESIERGYAGKSIFKWDSIKAQTERIRQYARANASIGINGSVLNNVNASPKILNTSHIKKVKYVADLLRPYGIRVYLSINFASPMVIGNLDTADPLDGRVIKWWNCKVKEIYKAIPDFGGFLVKANCEGQPGPGDFHRTHAEGANMLADAVKPYGGIIMWRSFVYGNHKNEDRVMQAVTEFKPLDGTFRDNVILQCKNGPLDFQPREPYAPIFDQMKRTPLMAELQITQEYLGQSRHLVYLAPMWKEFFNCVSPQSLVGIAGVANIGDDANWCGHHFSQANWYAFGRLAWNPSLTAEDIAGEWLSQTFNSNATFSGAVLPMMLSSREACVDYMMPLGLHHIFKADHHYGPEPEGNQPNFPMEWRPVYYHKANADGIGFERSSKGTGATMQYRAPYAQLYDDINTCPDELLLWFHHVPWTHVMHSGLTLWQELSLHYDRGVKQTADYLATWRKMKPYVDEQRFTEVEQRLIHQNSNAQQWKEACLGFFGKMKERK